VVAGDIDDFRSPLRLAQNFEHHVIVALDPEPGFLQAPEIDDVADEVKRVAVMAAEELQQKLRLAAPRSQMNVGNPNGAVAAAVRERKHASLVSKLKLAAL